MYRTTPMGPVQMPQKAICYRYNSAALALLFFSLQAHNWDVTLELTEVGNGS
jgi:hypothetical protein